MCSCLGNWCACLQQTTRNRNTTGLLPICNLTVWGRRVPNLAGAIWVIHPLDILATVCACVCACTCVDHIAMSYSPSPAVLYDLLPLASQVQSDFKLNSSLHVLGG